MNFHGTFLLCDGGNLWLRDADRLRNTQMLNIFLNPATHTTDTNTNTSNNDNPDNNTIKWVQLAMQSPRASILVDCKVEKNNNCWFAIIEGIAQPQNKIETLEHLICLCPSLFS